MSDKELFTGERFIPGVEDDKLEIEHYQRYLSVRKLVENKVVLDAACGEGYGSNILATVAKQVTGIDIDEDTVLRARESYKVTPNVTYLQGSIEKLPIEDNSVDVVVSFETIEHVPEETQEKFLNEISRVLKKDGILIMSTPNKRIYSDMHNYKNEFHIKEFYHDEFVDFLKGKFQYVQMYNQAFEVVSLITACEKEDNRIDFYNKNDEYNQEGKYYIAIASNSSIDEQKMSSVYVNVSGEYEAMIQRIIKLQREEEVRNQHIAKLDEEAAQVGNVIRELQAGEEERNRHIQKLDSIIEMDNQRISLYEEELAHKNLLLTQQKDFIDQQKEIIDQQMVQIKKQEELQETIESMKNSQTEEMANLQQTLRNKEGHIELLLESERRLNNEVANLQQIVRNKEGHIELLLESERAAERERNSRTYKLAKRMQKVIQVLFPADSRRRFFVRVTGDCVRHPIKMLKVIGPKRMKSYFAVKKTEGMAGVRVRYMEAKLKAFNIQTDCGTENEVVQKAEVETVVVPQAQAVAKTINDYEKFSMPTWENPTVSIVIPVYNQFDYTYECLKSIRQNSGDVSYEILIANDCSTDITKDIEKIVENVKLITTKENVRFLLNCNNAAKYAKGKYILFLNNDTQVKENWLEPLVSLIERDDTIGMVGSKLVYPDGTLQEAGGIVWKDASAWNYGNRKDPEDPEFNYVKEADYISGAAIMIKHSLWKELGGFDERFAPAYYEDTDLAFQVRAAGYKVMYQPLSVVVHFEGVSNGTDVSTGLKHYQQVNFEKFYEKWKDVLEAEHEVNAENVFTAKDRSNHKKHILVVDHYVPHHDQDAGGKCTYMYLQTFVKMGFKVTFIGDNFFKHEPYTTQLNQFGIEVLYGNYYYNNWQQWLKDNAHYFDYIYLQRPHISVKYIDLVKEYSNAKILYFAHDLHHIREYREYEMTQNPEKLESSQKWKKIEYELFEKSDVGHVVGSFEQKVMQEAFPNKPIRNIPLYIYEQILTDINKNFSERNDLLYVGGFGHPPNIDAVLWFAKEIFPSILKKYPDMKWHVVGGKVPLEIQELASDNIIIEGFVSDEVLEQLYRKCRLAVVPLRFGAGVKGKVVEAGYFQIPLITTSIGAEGLTLDEGSMLVEDDADKMAALICDIYEDYDRLRTISDNAVKFIENHFTLKEAERVLRLDIDI